MIKMNMTNEQYLRGFEESLDRLPGIVKDWYSIDPDLRENYTDQFQWMIDYRPYLDLSNEDQLRLEQINMRLSAMIGLLDDMNVILPNYAQRRAEVLSRAHVTCVDDMLEHLSRFGD